MHRLTTAAQDDGIARTQSQGRGIGRDITDRKRSEQHIHFLATHDSLTSLPNRFMFSQILNLAIESAHRYHRKLAVFFIDLDRFKNINDTLGHEAGDFLLCEMAARLKQCLRASDVVGRLGGDEFVILSLGQVREEFAESLGQRIKSAIAEAIHYTCPDLPVSASVGVLLVKHFDGASLETLLARADQLMYEAKKAGKNQVLVEQV